MVDCLLAAARGGAGSAPEAVVVPHAGYAYSGPVAAAAYGAVAERAREIRHVVLFGPPHFVPLEGAAVPAADAWATPLGVVPVAEDLRAVALRARADPADLPHAPEHSLEVQLPFLQRVLRHEFSVLPVAIGEMSTNDAADLVAALWGGSDTLVVVSTDLSHYLDDETARAIDRVHGPGDHGPEAGRDRRRGGLWLPGAARFRRARAPRRAHDRAPRARHVGGHVRRPLPGRRLRGVRRGRIGGNLRPSTEPGRRTSTMPSSGLAAMLRVVRDPASCCLRTGTERSEVMMSTSARTLERPEPDKTSAPRAMAAAASPLVISIVGIDGCGKSSTFEDALAGVAERLPVVGIGDRTLSGGPDEPLRERLDIPRSRLTQATGRLAKGLRWRKASTRTSSSSSSRAGRTCATGSCGTTHPR